MTYKCQQVYLKDIEKLSSGAASPFDLRKAAGLTLVKNFSHSFQTRDGNPIELRLLHQLLIYSSDTSSDAPTNISIIGPI